MNQIKVFTGMAEGLEKQTNAWLEKHPTIKVEYLSVSSNVEIGRGTFATIVILWRPGKPDK